MRRLPPSSASQRERMPRKRHAPGLAARGGRHAAAVVFDEQRDEARIPVRVHLDVHARRARAGVPGDVAERFLRDAEDRRAQQGSPRRASRASGAQVNVTSSDVLAAKRSAQSASAGRCRRPVAARLRPATAC